MHVSGDKLAHLQEHFLNVYTAFGTMQAATIPNWYSEINVTFYCMTLARTIRLPDDGPRTETCRSVLMF